MEQAAREVSVRGRGYEVILDRQFYNRARVAPDCSRERAFGKGIRLTLFTRFATLFLPSANPSLRRGQPSLIGSADGHHAFLIGGC